MASTRDITAEGYASRAHDITAEGFVSCADGYVVYFMDGRGEWRHPEWDETVFDTTAIGDRDWALHADLFYIRLDSRSIPEFWLELILRRGQLQQLVDGTPLVRQPHQQGGKLSMAGRTRVWTATPRGTVVVWEPVQPTANGVYVQFALPLRDMLAAPAHGKEETSKPK